MGSISDYHDLKRFMRSKEGQELMEELRDKLEGARIKSVTFSNELEFISMTLHIEGGESIELFPPMLELGYIREKFEDVLEREYLDDPDLKPPRHNTSPKRRQKKIPQSTDNQNLHRL